MQLALRANAFAWFLRTLLASALALWVFPGLPLWTPVRFFIAAATLLLIPGTELARRFAGHVSKAEMLVAGFGIQLLLVSVVTVATFQAGWHARGASGLFLLAGLVATAWRFRPHDLSAVRPGRTFDTGTMLALLVVMAAISLYFVGVPFDGFYGEDFLAIGYIRKLATLETIRPDNYMYKTPATLAYVYAPFHFWEAMIVSLSGLDPIVIYHRIRALWFTVSILIYVVLIGALTGRPRTARLGGIVLVLLTASTFAGAAYAWGLGIETGQLAPFSHPADFAIGILAPLSLTLAVALVLAESGPWVTMLMWLAPLVPCAVFLIHPREVLQYLVYVAVLGGALVLSGRIDRPRVVRLGVLVAVPLLFAFVVGATVMKASSEVTAFEDLAMSQWHQRYGRTLASASSALFGPPIWDPGGQSTDFQILWKLPGYALFAWLAPMGLAFRRSPGALWLAMGCIGLLALIRIPALSYLFVSATYSQALFSGEVYLYPVVYTLIALVIALGAEGAVARWGFAGIAAALGMGAALAAIAALAMDAGRHHPDILLAGTLVSAIVAVTSRWITVKISSLSLAVDGRDTRVFIATLVATVPLALLGTGFRAHVIDSEDQIEGKPQYGNERPSLPEFAYNQYQRTWIGATDWTRRFDRTFSPDQFTIPPAIMATLTTLPGPAVVDGPFKDDWLVEVHLFTSHYLVHSGTAYMLDQVYRTKYLGAGEPHPVFCASEDFDAERARRYLADNRVRYLLLDPPHAFVSKRLPPSAHALFVDDASGWSIVETDISR